jgi:hypothetical protein
MSKNINIHGHKFNVCSPDELKNRSGIYAILCQTDNKCKLIDVGESGKVKNRIKNHNRKKCWKKISKKLEGNLFCAVKYTPYKRRSGRRKIEKGIRKNKPKRRGLFCGLR